jgi:ADP-L-glycero-D-manno-heptose 6-epimerase
MILVTGGAGFIGSHVVEALNQEGKSDIVIVDNLTSGPKALNLRNLAFRDFIDKSDFRRQLALGKLSLLGINRIYHLGACTRTTEADVDFLMDNNYIYSKELLHFAIEHGIPFLYASSAAVYGQSMGFREEVEFEKPLNAYGSSKLALDNYVRSVWHRCSTTILGLRFFNVYGPREAHKGRMSSAIHHFLFQARTSGTIRVFKGSGGLSHGEQRRDFVYVADVVRALLYFGQGKDAIHGIINVGTGRSRTFNEVARCVIATMHHGHIEYIDFPEDLRDRYQDLTRADLHRLQATGCPQPVTDIEDGVALTASAHASATPL